MVNRISAAKMPRESMGDKRARERERPAARKLEDETRRINTLPGKEREREADLFP